MNIDNLIKEAMFYESQVPNIPLYLKYEYLMNATQCTEAEAVLAFREAQAKIYV